MFNYLEFATIKSNIKFRATYLNESGRGVLVWAHNKNKNYAYIFTCSLDFSVTVTDVLDAERDISTINTITDRMKNYART